MLSTQLEVERRPADRLWLINLTYWEWHSEFASFAMPSNARWMQICVALENLLRCPVPPRICAAPELL